MKKIILILMCFISIFSFFACSNEKINIEDSNIINAVKEKMELINNEYYLKHSDEVFNQDDVKEKLYVKVGEGFKTAYSVSFGMVSFENKEKVKFNIGNNSFIYTTAFYLKKKELYVFAPLLALEGGTTNSLLFCVDGLYFSTKIFDGDIVNLKIDKVVSSNNTSVIMETNEAERKVVTQNLESKDDKIMIKILHNGNELPNGSLVMIRKSYQKYDEATEYTISKVNVEGYIEIDSKDVFEEVKKEKEKYIDIHLGSLNGGVVGFDFILKYESV